MGIGLLNDVKEENKFWLCNGRVLTNLKELYKDLRRMNDKTFKHHVNETRNDFYNWARDVYCDKALSDDLLDCTTKEAMLFCLGNHLKRTSVAKSLDELPKGYSREENLFINLPKGYETQRIKHENITMNKKLVTLINLDEVRTKSEVKDLFRESKKVATKAIRTDNPFEEISKKSMKKVKALDSKSMMRKLKEVYGFE